MKLIWALFVIALIFLLFLEGTNTGMGITTGRTACVEGQPCRSNADCQKGAFCSYVRTTGRNVCVCGCNYDGNCDAPERDLGYCPDCPGPLPKFSGICIAGMACGTDEHCGNGFCEFVGSYRGFRKSCTCLSIPYGGSQRPNVVKFCSTDALCRFDSECGSGYCKKSAFSIGRCLC